MRKNLLPTKPQLLGKLGEDFACQYLQTCNFRIIDRNVVLLHGELDIVAISKKTVVIIEVKTRSNTFFGEPIEAVTKRKLNVLTRTAQLYLQKHPNLPEQVRIDVVSLIVGAKNEIVSLRHDENVTG